MNNHTSHKRHFASDNYAGIHPEIMHAIQSVNTGHAHAYGEEDEITDAAINVIKTHFGNEIDAYFVLNGTGANIIGIQTVTRHYHAVIAPDCSHINCDECGALERLTGTKLITIPADCGKITSDQLLPVITGFGNQHHSQPRVVSISQSTEFGTVYTPSEIKAIAAVCHSNNMLLHIDGARIANAAAGLSCAFKDFTTDAGVDILSFGGTKNGLMIGEVLLFFNKQLSENCKYIRKQGLQLYSKMRFVAAQFHALLSDNLWYKNASHANAMAQRLASALRTIPQITIRFPVQANAVFADLPATTIPLIQQHYKFYTWQDSKTLCRFMCSFDTTNQDVDGLVNSIVDALSKTK